MNPAPLARILLGSLLLTVLTGLPAAALAHAFGQRYDLPLPLSLYLWGAGLAVLFSFLLAAVFLRVPNGPARPWSVDIAGSPVGRLLTSAIVRHGLQALSLALFTLVIVAGLFGTPNTAKNFAPIFIWVIWWVGFAYLAALLGNLWDLINPWRVLHDLLGSLIARVGRHQSPHQPLDYPTWLGTWPALVLFAVFAWLEFISGVSERPQTLSWLIICYTAITLLGMAVFGRDTWLRNAETFSVVFGLTARFGLFHGISQPRRLLLRPPGVGLVSEQPVTLSMMGFTLLMLTTVSFDGLVETALWASIQESFVEDQRIAESAAVVKALQTAALVLLYAIAVTVYLAFSSLVAHLSGYDENLLETARAYVLSLVPIAIAYHLAHYLSYLLIAGQLIIPVASDPLGLGWDLFGTAGYRVKIGVMDARDVWYVSLGAIVTGHVFAVGIAHAIALKRSHDRRKAIIGQVPMLVLMVAYTMISLWILSQPIVAT